MPCRHWQRDGSCPVGDECAFLHDGAPKDAAPAAIANPQPEGVIPFSCGPRPNPQVAENLNPNPSALPHHVAPAVRCRPCQAIPSLNSLSSLTPLCDRGRAVGKVALARVHGRAAPREDHHVVAAEVPEVCKGHAHPPSQGHPRAQVSCLDGASGPPPRKVVRLAKELQKRMLHTGAPELLMLADLQIDRHQQCALAIYKQR